MGYADVRTDGQMDAPRNIFFKLYILFTILQNYCEALTVSYLCVMR